ncbi:thiopeptide-type bacteriocin biosynthesis protein [Bacillus sp. FSL W7-1360]
MTNTEWVFYSVYPGRVEYLDDLVAEVVAPCAERLSAREDVHRWFYIRYIDEQGPHIRLRFQVNIDSVHFIEKGIEELLERELFRITSEPIPKMTRLIPFHPDQLAKSEAEVIFQQEIYEPEYEKYGGKKGVDIAERCFESSSMLALVALKLERARVIDRFNLSLCIMDQATKELSFSERECDDLWEEMLHHWSGSSFPGGEEYKEKLVDGAKKRRQIVDEMLKGYESNSEVKEAVSAYCHCLKEAFDEVEASPQIRLSKGHLMFHYTHMMNNRLGVWPIEEAYLAAILQEV